MTRADDRGGPQPAHERARPLHRPPGDRQPGHAPGRREFDARAVFEACAEHDVAVEINSRPERRDPPTELLELARDIGCLFSIDSDAHAPGQLDFLVYGCERAEQAGIDPDRIVNTWPQDRLLAWANGVRFAAHVGQSRRWRYAARSGAAAPSRRTATATGSS